MRKIKYSLRPNLNVIVWHFGSFLFNFDRQDFCLCYIINLSYMNGLGFKCILHWYNFYQVLYNINKNIYGQNCEKKTWEVKLGHLNWNGGSTISSYKFFIIERVTDLLPTPLISLTTNIRIVNHLILWLRKMKTWPSVSFWRLCTKIILKRPIKVNVKYLKRYIVNRSWIDPYWG